MNRRRVIAGLSALATVLVVGVGSFFASALGDSPSKARFTAAKQDAAAGSASPPPSSAPTSVSGPSPQPAPLPEPAPEPESVQNPVPTPAGPCEQAGPNQLKVEQYLAQHLEFGSIVVDGVQTPSDCETIKAFQRRYAIYPAEGTAGPVTGEVAGRLASAAIGSCSVTTAPTICLDLTSQTMWVVRDGAIVLGPTPVRTGRAGLTTPSGNFTITEKLVDTISTIYHVPLPNWQRFYADMGFHTTPSYLYEGPGSHGCVNVLPSDSDQLYSMTSIGTAVHIFGRKPGT